VALPLITDWIASHLPADEIGEISALATEIFGDAPVATAWLREPNLAMDNKAPIALLGTQEGFNRVKNLLLRIQYGVLA
jgi:putative toxin-antitoxin system antitoxin component (TIGR02293 family)